MIPKKNKTPAKKIIPSKPKTSAKKKPSLRFPKIINRELDKSTVHIIVEIIEYVRHSVVTKTIIKVPVGKLTLMEDLLMVGMSIIAVIMIQ